MGFVDRGGGREAKGASLRRSKKNPGAASSRNKGANKNYITPTTRATPTPPTACVAFVKAIAEANAEANGADGAASPAAMNVVKMACAAVQKNAAPLHIDTAVALLSRKLEDDQEGIFRRATEDGKLAGALCWSNEVEKQAALLDTCVQHNKLLRGAADSNASTTAAAGTTSSSTSAGGATRHVRFHEDALTVSPVAITPGSPQAATKVGVVLYAMLGVHVNSIDRVNMRLHEQWIKELEENVKHGDVVAVLSGLNLSRDHGTHYAQERLLRECWRVAATAGLPLVLHLYAADAAALTETVNRAAELLNELLAAAAEKAEDGHAAPSAVVLHNGLAALHASAAMQQLVRTHRPQQDATAVPFHVLVTADGLVTRATAEGEDEDKTGGSASIAELASLLPSRAHQQQGGSAVVALSQLLIGTGSPFGTPQNLPDAYLCSLPNEPGNYPFVVQTVFEAMAAAADGDALASAEELSAHVFVNQLRVFFHECVEAAEDDAEEKEEGHVDKDNNNNKDDEDDEDALRQRRWLESQQPAGATVVAGLTDSAAKRDLEALLAEAARERERVEAERLREEAEQERLRNEELLEKRSKHEKKKHVKANNRSNFSHFRNKDFAPKGGKGEKTAQQREAGEESDDDDSSSDVEETKEATVPRSGKGKDTRHAAAAAAGTSGSSSSDDDDDAADSGDDNNAANSLAAEVEKLLRGAEAEKMSRGGGGGAAKAKKAKKNAKAAAATPPPAPQAAASQKQQKAKKGKGAKARSESDDDDEANNNDNNGGEDDAAMMVTSQAATRRQRKRQQKRQQQQQQRGDDSDDSGDA